MSLRLKAQKCPRHKNNLVDVAHLTVTTTVVVQHRQTQMENLQAVLLHAYLKHLKHR